MSQRPRIDLDGVSLSDPDDPLMPLVAFRFRTKEGLLFQIPESGELLVAWTNIESANLDLGQGRLQIAFRPQFAASQPWLRGTRVIAGDWLDRYQL